MMVENASARTTRKKFLPLSTTMTRIPKKDKKISGASKPWAISR